MASELKRGAVRILTNYTRLLFTVFLGLALVPVLLRGVGTDLYGLWVVIASAVGIGEMFRDIVRLCMNRELGAALHSKDEGEFARVYNSAIFLSVGAAGLALATFAALAVCAPLLSIPDELLWTARVFIACKAASSIVWIALTPQLNMNLVTERMGWHNLWLVLDRASQLTAAVVIFFVFGLASGGADADPAEASRAFVWFGVVAACISITIALAALFTIVRLQRGLRPRPWLATRQSVRSLLRTSSWNAVTVTAMNLHTRVDHLIMNVAFGLVGNAVFGVASQLGAYVRMLTVGMTEGLDAVTARFSTTKSGEALRELLKHSTRMHAAVAVPAAALVIVLAEPALRLWVGRYMASPDETIPAAVVLTRLLIIGYSIRAVSECWTRVAYGAGHVARYAKWVLAGGVANPVLAVLFLATLPGGDDLQGARFMSPALAFVVSMVVFHFGVLPVVCARALGVPLSALLRPILRPVVVAGFALPSLLAFHALVDEWTVFWLASAAASYGALVAALTWFVVLDSKERGMFVGAGRRRLPGSGRRRSGSAHVAGDEDEVVDDRTMI
ncbi:MAG: oligosaccharide flippase family protein [Phycisphaeraceae bacterium]|nr:oligosaccharide flippase family protein [Phycisphaeraceae bacterium]